MFWHSPVAGAPTESFEAKLASFHDSLNACKPDGFVEALSFRVAGLPWGHGQDLVYEDWYVVEDFAALGTLNDAAVSGPTRGPHDAVAKDFMEGSGGVFKLISGSLDLHQARFAAWIGKKIGPSYDSYYEDVSHVVGESNTDLWRRQMVLGPSPQFCVHSVNPVSFPEEFRPLTVRLELLAPK